MKYGLGRIHQPDSRDHSYLLSAPAPTRSSRFWWGYKVRLDQGQTPQCTAYAWSHFYVDAPTTHPAPYTPPGAFYVSEQKIDGIPGPHEGSTVRAGAQVLQAAGHCHEYRWAFNLETVIANVLEVGPVVIGSDWYDRMFDPGPDNFVRIGGSIVGGHAYVLDGVNVPKRFFRLKNSWGTSWGKGGFARISFTDLEDLLTSQGEACLAIET